MNFDISYLKPWEVITLAVIYLCCAVLLLKLADQLLGEKAVQFFGFTVCLPATLVILAGVGLRELARLPVKYYANRRLQRVFGLYRHGNCDFKDSNQVRVDETLKDLARSAQACFDIQEDARKTADDVDMRAADDAASSAKKVFWGAHNLARSAGYSTRPQISNYL